MAQKPSPNSGLPPAKWYVIAPLGEVMRRAFATEASAWNYLGRFLTGLATKAPISAIANPLLELSPSKLYARGYRVTQELPNIDTPKGFITESAIKELYVMQNAYGLIKIGRSQNPERRRQQLERQLGCSIALVSRQHGRGLDEEKVHLALQRHHLSHEWFKGSHEARRAVARILKLGPGLAWPYQLDELRAAEWATQFMAAQADSYWRSRRRRVIGILKGAELALGLLASYQKWGFASLDADIWSADNPGEVCVITTGADGRSIALRNTNQGAPEVPHYTTELTAAMTLWPVGSNPYSDDPKTWPRMTAFTCCIAALGARWDFDVSNINPKWSR